MCWEDASIDRQLLGIDEQSKIMMISSAGCNALSYLLDNPNCIHSVDINPRQTALLELKLSILKQSDYPIFSSFFWDGWCEDYHSVYSSIRSSLIEESKAFWDEHIDYFSPSSRGFHFEGGSGMFARFLNKIVDRKSLREQIIEMSISSDKKERERIFNRVEKVLWSGAEAKIWQTNGVLSLAGIPAVQRNAIGDINQFMQKVLRQIFVDQRADNNPYWGRYLKLPTLNKPTLDYLQEENFNLLRDRSDRIHFSTISFSDYLSQTTQKFTHFVLLDHMDWMVGHDKQALDKEWEYILERAEPGAKVLFRTAFDHLDFIPNFVHERCKIDQVDPQWLKENDRVGTYTGTYFGVIE
ncbi:MAG: DUF3419 family protein [Balneolaceae bacterium]|nr:DUF3419 family protein [Balneolaceae bacterium]